MRTKLTREQVAQIIQSAQEKGEMPDSTLTSEKVNLHRKIVGVKVRYARTKAGFSLEEAGDALGISPNSVADIEFGQRDVGLPQLEIIAMLCNIPVTFFWSDDVIEESSFDFPSKEAIALRQRIIGVLLRQARTKAGRTQEQIANFLDVPVSKISEYEFGNIAIPLHELEPLTEHLNVSLSYFIDNGIAPNKPIEPVPPLPAQNIDQTHLPPEIQEFLSNPANLLYVDIAMKLSEVSAETLRALAEGLLEVTY